MVGFAAEDSKAEPARLIRIVQDELRPGKSPAYRNLQVRYAQALTQSKGHGYYQALVSVTGPDETWFVTPYESYAAMALDQAENPQPEVKLAQLESLSADLVNASRVVVAINRPDLGYWPGGAELPTMRAGCFSIQIVATAAGHAADFVEARKLMKAAHEKAAIRENFAVYQVESGLPSGTFLIVIPYASLSGLDTVAAEHGRPYDDAVGDEGRKRLQSLLASSVVNSETRLFTVDLKMSHAAP